MFSRLTTNQPNDFFPDTLTLVIKFTRSKEPEALNLQTWFLTGCRISINDLKIAQYVELLYILYIIRIYDHNYGWPINGQVQLGVEKSTPSLKMLSYHAYISDR